MDLWVRPLWFLALHLPMLGPLVFVELVEHLHPVRTKNMSKTSHITVILNDLTRNTYQPA